jgi:hypothetical protein
MILRMVPRHLRILGTMLDMFFFLLDFFRSFFLIVGTLLDVLQSCLTLAQLLVVSKAYPRDKASV